MLDAARLGEASGAVGDALAPASAVPVAAYRELAASAGIDASIAAIAADPTLPADIGQRRSALAAVRADIAAAPVDPTLVAALGAEITALGGGPARLWPSTNAEGNAESNAEGAGTTGVVGVGLYPSVLVSDPSDPALLADGLRSVWASLWTLHAYDERARARMDQTAVAMAVLAIPEPDGITARGAAVTANLYDPGVGGEDAFFIQVAPGADDPTEHSHAPAGSMDRLVYYYLYNNQPATYYARAAATPVLSRRQLFDLGDAGDGIRARFRSEGSYAPPPGYASLPMQVGFRRIGDGDDARIEIESVRPHPGRGAAP